MSATRLRRHRRGRARARAGSCDPARPRRTSVPGVIVMMPGERGDRIRHRRASSGTRTKPGRRRSSGPSIRRATCTFETTMSWSTREREPQHDDGPAQPRARLRSSGRARAAAPRPARAPSSRCPGASEPFSMSHASHSAADSSGAGTSRRMLSGAPGRRSRDGRVPSTASTYAPGVASCPAVAAAKRCAGPAKSTSATP